MFIIISYIIDVVVAPPTCYLSYVKERLPSTVEVSAQNCYKLEKGAYTGEIRYEAMKVSMKRIIILMASLLL